MQYKIGFIGAGNMAFALAKAIKKAGLAKAIVVSDINKERLDFVKSELKVNTTKDNKEVVKKSDILFLAVKPQVMDNVVEEIKDIVDDQLVISIAAGVRIKELESKLKKVVRVMPNTPCLVGEMAAGFAVGKNVSDKEIKLVEEILNSAGKAFYLKEGLLDAVTGLSGSGPAFVARLIEGLIEGGIKSGLNRDIATELALQTVKGTAKLLQESGMGASDLIEMVSSPGGTTVEGRKILEGSDVKDVLVKTVKKATEKSKELGR